MDNWRCCKCSAVLLRCTYSFLKSLCIIKNSTKRKAWGVSLLVCVVWWDVSWNVSSSYDLQSCVPLVRQRFCVCSAQIPVAAPRSDARTHTASHSQPALLCHYTNAYLHFPPGFRGIWGKFNDAAKSILFEIPRDVGRVQGGMRDCARQVFVNEKQGTGVKEAAEFSSSLVAWLHYKSFFPYCLLLLY